MEIKAYLDNYTDEQRTEFILEYNRRYGYKLEETPERLEAWGYTEDEIAQQERETEIEQIKQQLNDLDLKSIRAIRSNDTEYIELYEQEAEELRSRLQELEK